MRDDLNQNPRELGGQSGILQERKRGKPVYLHSKDSTIQPEMQAATVDLAKVKSSELASELLARLEDQRAQILQALAALEGGQDG